MFAQAGIHSAEEIRALGAIEAHRRLQVAGVKVLLVGRYTFHVDHSGRDWRALSATEREWLRSAASGAPRLAKPEAELDRLSLPLPPTIAIF